MARARLAAGHESHSGIVPGIPELPQGGRRFSAAKPRQVVPLRVLGLVRRVCLAAVVLAVVLEWAASAAAHQLYVFAQADGRTIRGEAYFRGRIPAQNLPVRIFGPAGEELGRTETDGQGHFTFEAQRQCDHRLVVATADGHQAEYVLSTAELAGAGPPAAEPPARQTPPSALAEQAFAQPPRSGQAPSGARATEQAAGSNRGAGAVGQSQQPRSSPAETDNETDELAARIEALQWQVGALRREFGEFEQTVRLRDVLGGIGYIVGLAGVAFYFLGIGRQQQRAGRKDQ